MITKYKQITIIHIDFIETLKIDRLYYLSLDFKFSWKLN